MCRLQVCACAVAAGGLRGSAPPTAVGSACCSGPLHAARKSVARTTNGLHGPVSCRDCHVKLPREWLTTSHLPHATGRVPRAAPTGVAPLQDNYSKPITHAYHPGNWLDHTSRAHPCFDPKKVGQMLTHPSA